MAAELTESKEPTPLALIELAIKNKMSPDQLGQLYDLARQWRADRAAEAFANAMTEFQSKCPRIPKTRIVFNKPPDKGGPATERYRFSAYEDVMSVVGPLLAANRIVVNFSNPSAAERTFSITVHLRVGTFTQDCPFSAPLPNMQVIAGAMRTNEAQAYGCVLSYFKRYALCTALNIVVCDEDEDAVADAVERVGEEEADELAKLIHAAGRDQKKFLEWAGVDDLRDVPLSKYREAKSMLRPKEPKKAAAK